MKKIFFILTFLLIPTILLCNMNSTAAKSKKTVEVSAETQELLTPKGKSWKLFFQDTESTKFFVDTNSVEQTGDLSFSAIFRKTYVNEPSNHRYMSRVAQRKGVTDEIFLVEFYHTDTGICYTVHKSVGFSVSGKLLTGKDSATIKETFLDLDHETQLEYKAALKYLPDSVQNDFKEFEKERKHSQK